MIPITKAIKIIERESGRLGSERIPLADASGRILHEDIVADTDLPPFDRSQMDGYAVVAADTKKVPVSLKLVGESAAGRGWHRVMKRGEAVRIMTGAPLPVGADAVQKVEVTAENGDGNVEILEPTAKERFIIRRGSEIKKGKVVFKSGERITENMVTAIASFGYAKVNAAKLPRIAILSTGSEIVPITKKPGRDQIRNSNSVMLDVLARRAGAATTVLPIAHDDIDTLKAAIKGTVKTSDILVITGGVSVGKYDHTKDALTGLGAEIFFDKVRLKPGKPAVFARLGKTLVFGLPGNPVSSAVTFYLFVRTAMMRMSGASQTQLRSGYAVIDRDLKANRERDTYLPVALETNDRGSLVAIPLKWSGSSDFIGFARAEALAIITAGKNAAAGDVVSILSL